MEAYIVDACRTPRGIGKVGKGALAHLHPQHLAATVLAALRDRNSIDTSAVDDIIWCTSTQRGSQGSDLGRMAALDAGYDVNASGVTISRFCGSGISSVSLAAGQIMSGFEDVVIAGGTEMMSYTASIADPKNPTMMDAGNMRLRAKHPQSQQGVCADAIVCPFLNPSKRQTGCRGVPLCAPVTVKSEGTATFHYINFCI